MALAVAASGRFLVKAVAATLGVAKSNLVEQLQRPKRPQRGPYRRVEDEAVLGEIRTITDARPTYGYCKQPGLCIILSLRDEKRLSAEWRRKTLVKFPIRFASRMYFLPSPLHHA